MKTIASLTVLALGLFCLAPAGAEGASPAHGAFHLNVVPRDDPNSVEGEAPPPEEDPLADPPSDDFGDDEPPADP